MEPWKGMKRPWEEDSPIDGHIKRRGSTTAAHASASRQPSPLPQRAGYYSRDNRELNQRRLPPLHTSSWGASAETDLSASVQLPVDGRPPAPSDDPRARSQSLFNVLQYPYWQDSAGYTGKNIFPSHEYLARQNEALFSRRTSARHSLSIVSPTAQSSPTLYQ